MVEAVIALDVVVAVVMGNATATPLAATSAKNDWTIAVGDIFP